MKNIVFVGAGGLAKELYYYLQSEISLGKLVDTTIKGFVDFDKENFDKLNLDDNLYLGCDDSFQYADDDYALIAIGDMKIRNKVIAKLESNSVNFYTFIHSTAYISPDAVIGKGVIVSPYAMINVSAKVEDHCMINTYSSVAHDCILGRGSVLSSYCTINGDVTTGENLFMGTRSTILLGKTIGKNCTISAHTCVGIDLDDGSMVKVQAKNRVVKNRLLSDDK